jgi:hypothetical protein
MDKTPKSRIEIEGLVLRELQICDGCEGAAGISIRRYDDTWDRRGNDGPNWTVSAFNAGAANDYECERALLNIVPRLQGFYELVQKH